MGGQGEGALIFSPHLKEDCSRPPTKHTGSLSLLGFYLFHSSQCLSLLMHSQSSALQNQLQRAVRSEMLPNEIAKLVESSGFAADSNQLSMKRRIVISYLIRRIKAVEEAKKDHQFIIENTLLILLKHLMVYTKQSDSLKERLLRSATTSDRVGLLALVNRLASSEDPIVFDMVRRIRATLF
jgi:hypothetical protein